MGVIKHPLMNKSESSAWFINRPCDEISQACVNNANPNNEIIVLSMSTQIKEK
jgi:hypothetical protein